MGITKSKTSDKAKRIDLYPEKEKKNKKKNKGGILGGLGYAGTKLVTGALDVVEDTADVIIGGTADIIGGTAGLFGAKGVQKDLNAWAKKVHTDDYTDTWNDSLDEWYNPDAAWRTVGDVTGGVGQSLTYLGVSFIPYVGPAISTTLMAGSGAGSGIESAVEKTGKLGAKEYLYGGLSGATEVALESLTGAAGKMATKLAKPAAKSVAKTIGKESAEALAKKGAKSAAKKAARKGFVKTTFSGATGEFIEEAASTYLDAQWQRLTGVDKNARASFKDIAYSGFVGALSGGILSAGTQGIKNASNLSRGSRIVENNNAEAMVNTAKHISKAFDLKGETSGTRASEVRERFSESLQQIDKAVDAYEKLSDKTSTKAKLYLGEMQETVAYVETVSKAIETAKPFREALSQDPSVAERYAKTVSMITKKNVTAEDIQNNTPMFGKIGAMDMLGVIKLAGEIVTDKESTYEAKLRLEEQLKNPVVAESNIGADMSNVATEAQTATAPTAPTQTATPSTKSTLFAKTPTANAQVKATVEQNTSANTAENAQISTEAQGAAENANVQATTAETQNTGMESMQTEQGTAQNEKASANTEVKRALSKTKAEKLKADIRKLGEKRITKDAGGKKITILTDKFSEKKNIFSKEGRNAKEVNARIKNIPNLQNLIEKSKYVGVDTDIRLDNEAKAGVKAIYKFKTSVPGYDVEILVRDKGKKQCLYEVKFIENKKSSQQSMTGKPASTAAQAVVENADIVPQKKSKVNTSDKKTSKKSSTNRAISLEEAEEQRKESFDALLKEEEAKKEETPKQKTKTAEEIKVEEAAELEANKEAHWEAYQKARAEATLAFGTDGFVFLPAETRENIIRMYMELSGIKEVTAETKKALATIMAARPGLHVFASDKLADNGAWRYVNGERVIVVSKNSGAVTNALLHEITHDLAKENSKHYENLSKAVLANTSDEDKQKVYDAYLMRHLRDYNQIDESTTLEEAKRVFKTFSEEDQKHFDDMVKEEITTRAVAEKLGQKNFLHEHGKEHRFAIMKAIAHLRKLGSSLVHRSTADKYVRQLEKNFAEAVGMGKSNVKIPSFVDIDEADENHLTVMRSLESYLNAAHNEESGATRESGRDILLKYLTKTYGQGDAMQIVSQMDSIAEAMKAIESEHPELNIFSNWNSTQIEIDENGHPIFTTSVKNGDYELNQDFSRVCKKRRQLDYVLNYLAKNPDFRAEYLSKEDFVKINQAIKKHGFEIACDLCFVDAKRFRQAEWALSFENTWNDLFNSMFASGKVESFDFANGKKPSKTDVQFDESKPITYRTWSEGKVKETRKYSSLEEFFKKDGNANVKAMARFMLNHPEARRKFVAKDIISSEGFDAIQRYNRDLRGIFDGWGGSSVPKPSAGDTVYDNSIANLNQYNRETAFAMGGSRMNSFSDFMAHMFFDYCQAFSELAAKKMPVQSYTKELVFARLFGLTGAKINLSGVPAIRENASTKKKDEAFEKSIAGLNVDRLAEHLGKKAEDLTQNEILANLDLCDYLWSKESINMKYATLLQSGIMYDRIMDESVIDECYSLIQEGKFDEAFALAGEENVNKEYAKHVGTIVVGVSEAHIRKLLRDNTVRMVIPYHKSGLNPIVARAMKIALYNDYTDTQSTRIRLADGSKEANLSEKGMQATFGIKDFDFYEYFGKKIGGKVVDGKAVAKRYLEWCKNGVYDEKVGDYVYYTKDGYILASEFHKKAEIVPKFSQFSNEKNYYKVLEDFDTYDSITNKHSAQNSITFNANSLPSDYRSVLTGALEAEQNTYEDFISAFNNETKLDGIGLGEEIMGIMDEARERVEGETNIRRSINIEDRIISTHDERTKWEKGKDFVNTVRSRSAKENKEAALTAGQKAALDLQIYFTNDKAGIENQLVRVAKRGRNEVEAAMHTVTIGARKGKAMITNAQTNIKGEIVGDSLMKILHEANLQANRTEINAYLLHLLNIDRAPRGKAVFKDVTAEESAKEVARLEKTHPEFKYLSQRLHEFNRNLIQLEVDAGLLSQKQADAFLKYNPHYITLVPLSDADINRLSKERKGRIFNIKDFAKQAKGGNENYMDVIDAYMDRIVSVTKNAYINVIANAVAKSEDGENVIVSREDAEIKGASEFDPDEFERLTELSGNKVTYFENGKQMQMNVNWQIMKGFESLHKAPNHYDDTLLGKFNLGAMRMFKGLVTSWNPFFLLRNPARDIQDGLINTRFGAEKFITAIYRARTEMFNNSALWQEYVANGGIDTSLFEYALGNEANKMGLKKAQGNFAQKALTKFENAQLIIEQMPRFAEYILSREAGNDVQTALWHSADVTVNFSRGGSLVKAANKYVIPFLNPAFQGMSRNFRLVRDAKKSKSAAARLAITAALLGILPMVLSNLMYEDDEEYQNLDDNLKANYYLFAFGEGEEKKFIRIPKGRVTSALASFTNVVQKGADVDEAVKNSIEQTSAFGSIRPFFSPVLDVMNNKTWYGGEIEGRQFENVAPSERYDEYTSDIAKYLASTAIGKRFDWSPKKIHYLLDQYSGAIGDFLLPMTADSKKANTTETLFASLITDPVYSNKLSSDFYDLYDEVNWEDDTLDNVIVKKHLDKVKKSVNDLYKDIDKINTDTTLSEKEKVSQARLIRAMINRTYKTALEDYKMLSSFSENVSEAYGSAYSVEEVTKNNYKALGLGKDDIGTYSVVYSVGDDLYSAQTRDTADEAQEYLEDAMERAAYADLVLTAYGAESAIEAYAPSFYQKATVAHALGADYENMYRLLCETRYMTSAEKKERVDDYLRTMPYGTNLKYLIKYIFGDTTKKTKRRAAVALKRSDVDDEIKKEWLKKLK